jgi:hypothetical protein
MSAQLLSERTWEAFLVHLIMDGLKNYPNSTLIGKSYFTS